MPERQVVITGMGLVTPLGASVAENLENLRAQKTGISAQGEGAGLPESLRYAGSVGELPPTDDFKRKLLSQMKFLNRGALLGFHSAREAVTSAGINLDDIPPGRRALYIASGDFNNIDHRFLYQAVKDASGGRWRDIDWEKLNTSTLNKVPPFFLLESIANNLFSFLSAFYEFMGPNTSIASLSPCGSHAVELAARGIAQGRADTALAVGCGSWITEIPLYELEGIGVLSSCRQGAASFRPLDSRRDGFIPGEGGAALLLEAEESAVARGATIAGRLRGFGNCIEHSGGRSFTTPARVAVRSIAGALKDSGIDASDLGFIVAHGSATQRGDRSELGSIADIFDKARARVPLCGLKPYTGHMGAASDVAEIIFGVDALAKKTVPATLNFTSAESDFKDMMISASPQPCSRDSFLSVSYGVGGESSTVVVDGG
jgi:3-oxoacyl-[acyl-carrier-protein] synthase II